MSTASLVDYLSEKLHSLSSKMWGNSFQPSSTSFLMSENKNIPRYDLSSVFTEIRDRSDYHIPVHPSYHSLPLLRFATGIFGGFGQLKGLDKPSYHNNTGKEFSPYLFNSVTDYYRSKHMPLDLSLFFPCNNLLIPVKQGVFNESQMMNRKTKSTDKQKVCDPRITKMSLDVSCLPSKEKSKVSNENCDISRTMKLNIELAHRKTKELTKRSKKRRRRQKKSEQLHISNSASASDDDTNSERPSHITDSVYFLSKSPPDFGCTVSVAHTVQLSPRNSFFIPITSDDDSEWETFDEIELSAAHNVNISETDFKHNVNSSETDFNGSPTSGSSPMKCETLKSNCFKSVDCSIQISSVISFVVPEGDSSDDDSDWDTCGTHSFSENMGFELSGLYFNDLCTPQSYYKSECNFDSEEDSEEILQLRAFLSEANKKWNKLDEESQKPKSASKVTFAPDEDLIEVFPVEVFERKGEWEMYATERLRFKRKIDELEKVISPCLKPDHRSKIFKKLVEPEL